MIWIFIPECILKNIRLFLDFQQILVCTSEEIGNEIENQIKQFDGKKKGIHFPDSVDSTIVASYLPSKEVYTLFFFGGDFGGEEMAHTEYYAKYYGLNLHYVDISMDTEVKHLEPVMKAKGNVHSIEP